MSRLNLPNVVVGNEFLVKKPKMQVATPVIITPTIVSPASSPSPVIEPVLGGLDLEFEKVPRKSALGKIFSFLHDYSLGVFALLFMVVAGSAIIVGGSYWSAKMDIKDAATTKHVLVQPVKGPNTAVKTSDLDVSLQTISSQSVNMTIDNKALPVSSDTVRSWLKTVSNKAGVTYIHVDQKAVTKSLEDAVKPFAKAPVNQVVSVAADGTQTTIATGRNGTKVGDITPLVQQVSQNLISAKGIQLNIPTESHAFAVVPSSSFDKLIEVNVVTKQMWLYDKGVLYKQFPISAGAPETPTPIGQYQIYSKLAVQDMRGYNANGTKYFQPHVRWINYFLPGGYAVHGNYWRPQSWFGAVNSSHGCVSLPDDQAKVVYDWAPLGTTVITHN